MLVVIGVLQFKYCSVEFFWCLFFTRRKGLKLREIDELSTV